MALQKTVSLYPAAGIPGQEVVAGQAMYLAYNPQSDGTVKPGAFAFAKASSDSTGESLGLASATGSTLLGICVRVVDATIASVLDSVTETYPEGHTVTIAARGQFYALATGSATDGQHVLVNTSTGAVTYGSAATEGTVDSEWLVRIPNGGASASEGDVVIYERLG